jgi:Tol biopolymer transport system component
MKRFSVAAYLLLGVSLHSQTLSHASCEPKIALTRTFLRHTLHGFEHGEHVYLMNLDGTGTREIAEGFRPVWSRDATEIAFDSLRDSDKPELFLMNADGSAAHAIVKDKKLAVLTATWAPDDSRLAFDATIDGRPRIFTVKADGSDLKQITTDDSWQPDWSPDGNQIIFVTKKGQEVDSVDPDGGNLHTIISAPLITHCKRCFVAWPKWSPVGDKIAFVSDLEGTVGIYWMKPDGTQMHQITNAKHSFLLDLSWFPSGEALLFAVARESAGPQYVPPQVQQLMAVGIDTGVVSTIGSETGGEGSAACLSPK